MRTRRFQRWCVFAGLAAGAAGFAAERPNVLFVTVDDLRPALGCYGESAVVTPHFDALARGGTVFRRAYAQQAVCNPSRASFMTGLRPDSTGVYDLVTHFRRRVPGVVTLPQHFKDHGYHTVAFGKIYHPAFPGFGIGSDLGDAPSWSEPAWLGGPRYYHSPLGVKLARAAYAEALRAGPGAPNWIREAAARRAARPDEPESEDDWTKVNVRMLATEAPEVPDGVLYDGEVADRAIAALDRLQERRAATGQPFFLAVGFLKPHLPFVAPRRYWDLYDPAALRLPAHRRPPAGAPAIALAIPMDELRDTYPRDVRVPLPGQPTDPGAEDYPLPRRDALTAEQEINLLRGYYACVSFVDAQFGRIVAELERRGLADDTIVVVVGDHGFHLGHHGLWGKLTNFEEAVRSPLVIRAPGRQAPGRSTDALVELVDIYPTLCALAGLPAPAHLEGASLVPLLDDPDRAVKAAAFSQYPRAGAMGYSLRTDRHRLTAWESTSAPGRILALELYDHAADPGETVNLADHPGHAVVAANLLARLRTEWPGGGRPGPGGESP
jgi:arylsulfatase A-like enzyme